MKTQSPPTFIASAAAALIGIPAAFAQDAPAPELTIEQRQQSIANIREHIGEREVRITEIREDIITLDGRVEKRIDKIVAKLQSMTDSKDSQVRVAQTKESAIAGLRRSIEYYVRKRDQLAEVLRTGSSAIPDESLAATKAVFDERIEKRIGQIIDVSKSFAAHEELEKYERTISSSRRGRGRGYDSHSRISDDWRHNRKDVRHTEAQKKEITTALEASIARLDVQRRDLVEKLRSAKLSDGDREIFEADLGQTETLISIRQNQIGELHSSSGGGEAVSRNEAHRVQLAIRDSTQDLRDDFFLIFEKYDELQNERVQLAKLKESLKAREDWMAKNAADSK